MHEIHFIWLLVAAVCGPYANLGEHAVQYQSKRVSKFVQE